MDVSREATYDAYFQMQNAVARGYYSLRNKLARQRFGRAYDKCSPEQRDVIAIVYPQRISELLPQQEGGEP